GRGKASAKRSRAAKSQTRSARQKEGKTETATAGTVQPPAGGASVPASEVAAEQGPEETKPASAGVAGTPARRGTRGQKGRSRGGARAAKPKAAAGGDETAKAKKPKRENTGTE
ncbi:hypothetical protein ACFL59_12340, partial [Planctomycetota bacterium]